MRILFINGSPNKTGNTAQLAEKLLVTESMKHSILQITGLEVMVRIFQMMNLI